MVLCAIVFALAHVKTVGEAPRAAAGVPAIFRTASSGGGQQEDAAAAQPVRAAPASAGEYRVYSLRHQPAGETARMLRDMLPEDDEDRHVVADAESSQVLVRGGAETQRLARELIEAFDEAPQPPPAADEEAVVASYAVPSDRHQAVLASLEARYGDRREVRIGRDLVAGRIFVVAPPQVQAEIAEGLAAGRLGARPESLPADADAEPIGRVPTVPVERRYALRRARPEAVKQRLRELLGPRLRPADPREEDPQSFYLGEAADPQRATIAFVQPDGVVAVRGPEGMVEQFGRLLAHLDRPRTADGRLIRFLPIRHADPAQIEEAVRAYRTGRLDGPPRPFRPQEAPWDDPADYEDVPPLDPDLLRGGEENSQGAHSPHDPPGAFPREGIELVAWQPFDEEEEEVEPFVVEEFPLDDPQVLRDLGIDVEVETLPDLDVIILRGRERDVLEMMRIIEEIERISLETRPEIEIYPLRHVSGESLVTIMAQVTADLLGGMQGRVSVTPLGKPNALLIIGWGEAVEAMKELVWKLDRRVPPETELRVFRLRHAPAAQTAGTLLQFYAARPGLGTQLRVFADLRLNALVVQAAPRDMAEVAYFIERIDTDHTEAVVQARIFKLENTLAADIAATLQQAIDAARGVGMEKSSALELLTVDPLGERIVRSGVLADVRITPDARANTLIVSAPAETMDLLETLIGELDVPTAVAQIRVFRVVNGDAAALVQMLMTLLPAQPLATGMQLAEGDPSLAPLQFSVDARTNSIVATGSEGNLELVEALIVRLDLPDPLARQTTVIRLKNAPANEVAVAVNAFLSSERALALAAPGVIPAYQQIEQEVIVVPEMISNALIVSASERFFDPVVELIEELDAEPAQVMIQVLIAEVALGDHDEFGVELGLQDSLLFDRSVLSADGRTLDPGFEFVERSPGNSARPESLQTRDRVAGQGVSQFNMGRVSPELGWGGLILSASSESVSVLIRALQESNRLDVISRPQIMTLDNQPAWIQVGQRFPRIVSTQLTQFGQTNVVDLDDVGLILGVTPRVSPEGVVVMEVDAMKSEIGPEADGTPIAVSEGTVIRSPPINITTAQTTVSAATGETIVIGGLITKNTRRMQRGVPYLSDIPILGLAFRYDLMATNRTELLIILTPHVIRTPEDAERIKRVESARLHFCLADVNAIHGESGLCVAGDCSSADTQVIYPHVDPRGRGVQPQPTLAPPEEPWPAEGEFLPPGARILRDMPLEGDDDVFEEPPTIPPHHDGGTNGAALPPPAPAPAARGPFSAMNPFRAWKHQRAEQTDGLRLQNVGAAEETSRFGGLGLWRR